MILKAIRLIAISLACVLMLGVVGTRATAMTQQEFKAKVEQATKDLKDVTMVATVVYKNEKNLDKVDTNYKRLYELKSAKLSVKLPDKMRVDGKIGMVKFEYITNGVFKIFRAPRFSKKDDMSNDPAKLQDAFDVGLVTPSMWTNRSVEVVSDAESDASGKIKMRLRWPKGDMVYYAWINAQKLCLEKIEKRDGANKLVVMTVYSAPQNVGAIWMPTKAEMFASDGEKAGASAFSDIKINTGLADSLFQ